MGVNPGRVHHASQSGTVIFVHVLSIILSSKFYLLASSLCGVHVPGTCLLFSRISCLSSYYFLFVAGRRKPCSLFLSPCFIIVFLSLGCCCLVVLFFILLSLFLFVLLFLFLFLSFFFFFFFFLTLCFCAWFIP